MFCTQCGQLVSDGARFCNHCGAAVVSPATPASPPATAGASVPAPAPAPRATPAPAPTPAPTPEPASAAAPSPRPEPAPSYASAPASTSTPGATAGAASGASAGAGAGGFSSGPAAASAVPSAGAVPAFDPRALAQRLIARAKAILLTPSTEWPVIAGEATTPRAIYLEYVAPMAAIGVLATFIGHSLIGVTVPLFGNIRVPITAGIATVVVSYALTFVAVFVVSWLVDALAPTFDGHKDPLAALKVTAYAYTPAWVAAVLNLLPALAPIAALVGLYGLYLLYTGLPVLMRCPKEKSIGYTIVLVLCAIVMSVVIGSSARSSWAAWVSRASVRPRQ